MQASDVMVREVVTIGPAKSVGDAVKILAERDISALPVVDDQDNLIGIISEGDLIHRTEIGTEKHRPWLLESFTGATTLAAEFAKSHGQKVAEVMTAPVVTAREDTPLNEIATLFERHRIKRVPIVREGKVIGVVSRSNLIQALASGPNAGKRNESDQRIRNDIVLRMAQQRWTDFGDRNVTVANGVVHLWGLVGSLDERTALKALAEETPGVSRVVDEMFSAY